MKKITLIVFRIVSLMIIVVCLFFIYRWYKNNQSNALIQNEMQKLVTVENISMENTLEENLYDEKLIVNFKELKKINSDTVGWVRVKNTKIDLSVVQHSDNSYYLKHNFYKQSNSAGWIFADYRNSFDVLDKNTILYGHHMKSGIMFGDLPNLTKDSWKFEDENLYFSFATEEKSYKAQIFSVYVMKASALEIPNNFDSDDEFMKYIQHLEDLSIHDFDVPVNSEDNIITLCTCGNTNKYRVVVHAKLIELK